jgi:predicted branched-subunit amino acid permease
MSVSLCWSARFIGAALPPKSPAAVIILTTFVVNLRHALYAATLTPFTRHLPQRWLLPMGFWMTDETFAVAAARYAQSDDSPFKHWYYLGSAVSMYANWQLSTLLGVIAGQALPDARGWGLDFALIVTFIGLVVPMIKDRPVLVSVIASGLAAALTYSIPNRLGLMIAALVGVAAGLLAEALAQPSLVSQEEAAP